MKQLLVMILAASVLLAGCASRESVPQPSSSQASSIPSSQASGEPSEGSSQEEAEPSSSAEEALDEGLPEELDETSSASSHEELEPWEEDDSLRAPLEEDPVPADTQSITLTAEETAFPVGEVVLEYTLENGSTQVLAYTSNYVVEWQDSEEEWQRVNYPEGQEPQADDGITVLEPGESSDCTAEIPAEMLTAGGNYRIRRGVWAYEYEVNTPKGGLPDEELGRFDVTLEFTVG